MSQDNIFLGVVFSLLGFFVIAVMTAFAKAAGAYANSSVLVLFQNLIGLACLLPFCFYHGIRQLKIQKVGVLLWRTLTGAMAFFLLFTALKLIPMTNAVLLTNAAPIWMPVFGLLLYRETSGLAVWMGVAIGFVGIVFVLDPTRQFLHMGDLIATLAGITGGVAMLAVRQLRSENWISVLFYYTLFSSLIFAPIAGWNWYLVGDGRVWLLMIGIGASFILSQFCILMSYRYASAVKLSPLIYTVILFSALIDWWVWHQVPTIKVYIGIILIIIGGVMTMWRSR